MKRLTLLSALALLVSACGSSKPTGPPNPPRVRNGPPPAWVETRYGSHWLAYSSYCWRERGRERCADYAAPSCPSRRVPVIYLRQGGVVRFHLAFEPVTVEVSGEGTSRALKPARDPSWTARRRNGPMTLSVHARAGDVAYAACLRFNRVTKGINIHPND